MSSAPDSRSCLYEGLVVHTRFRPRPHKLRYRMFMALLDLDEIEGLDRRLKLFSHDRFNLFGFFDRDHLPKTAPAGLTLRHMVEGHLAGVGLVPDGGPIQLLSLPRILGYAFNPISVYFCHRRDGALAAILYEVRNTFKQRHTYVIAVEAPSVRDADTPIRQSCDKVFYVSPFLDMDLKYDFRITPPGTGVGIAIEGSSGTERIIAASFDGTRRPLSDPALLRAFLGHPLLGVGVVAGIYWEALKLWLKGVRLRARPAPPDSPATFVPRREV